MSTGMTPEQRIHDASRAREVLENEVYQWAFETLKQEILESWQQSPAKDPEGREKLWLSLKLLERVKTNMQARMESGKVAVLELEHRRTLAERAKAWLS